MTMLREIKIQILQLDPHDVVKCEMDNFSPYVYFQLPKKLEAVIGTLSDDDKNNIDSFLDVYLDKLEVYGIEHAKETMFNHYMEDGV